VDGAGAARELREMDVACVLLARRVLLLRRWRRARGAPQPRSVARRENAHAARLPPSASTQPGLRPERGVLMAGEVEQIGGTQQAEAGGEEKVW